jgi:deferrochelatase/peroxidase EfeB
MDTPETPVAATTHTGPDWAANGSFLVFRRLRQDVSAFSDFLETSATSLNQRGWEPPLTSEKFGAMLVGRWRSGAPILLSPAQDGGDGLATNDFGFNQERAIENPSGPIQQPADPRRVGLPTWCPYPQGKSARPHHGPGPSKPTLLKLLLRRGITYDLSLTEAPVGADKNDRGLLFLAFHRSIEDGFEFLMKNWVRRAARPESDTGHDPILSGGNTRFVKLHNRGNEFQLTIPGGWVLPTGGEYFFMPSKSFFRSLNVVV